MTEPTKQRKIWPIVSLLVLIALAGIGYYLDPEGEIVQEVTGINLATLTRREGSAVSPISEPTETEDAEPPRVEIKKAVDEEPQVVKVEVPVEEVGEEQEDEAAKVVDKQTPEEPTAEDTAQVPVQEDSPVEPEYKYGDLRAAVGRKDAAQIVAILQQKPDFAQIKDANGWSILHEAARSGLTESVRALVEKGNFDVMAKAGKNGDLLALDIALRYLKSDDHPTVMYLKSETEKKLKSSNGDDEVIKTEEGVILGPSSLLEAAIKNDYRTMAKIVSERPHWVDRKDANGWSVLHEMARAGRLQAVKFLVTEGKANVNARTSRENNGGSVLYHAVNRLGSDHPVVRYLTSVGAKQIAPGEKDEL